VDSAEPSLVDKIIEVSDAFTAAGIGHALGGALALAFYTRDPRATADIDLNVSVDPIDAESAFRALPAAVDWASADLLSARTHDQVRVWWGRTPIDLFFRAAPFHDDVAERSVTHDFAGRLLPFLAANDLAVFKTLFDRPKDWLDIEAMHDSGAADLDWIADTVASLLGPDPRVDRLRRIARPA
jgi:pimeloyl-ACP methyl ester carboxylesterase